MLPSPRGRPGMLLGRHAALNPDYALYARLKAGVPVQVITPLEYMGPIMELCKSRRGEQVGLDYLDANQVGCGLLRNRGLRPQRLS